MNRIRELREQNDLTLVGLGKILGISDAAVSQYEKGKRFPDREHLLKLADYFKVSIDYLLGRTNFRNLIIIRNSTTDDNSLEHFPMEALDELQLYIDYLIYKYSSRR